MGILLSEFRVPERAAQDRVLGCAGLVVTRLTITDPEVIKLQFGRHEAIEPVTQSHTQSGMKATPCRVSILVATEENFGPRCAQYSGLITRRARRTGGDESRHVGTVEPPQQVISLHPQRAGVGVDAPRVQVPIADRRTGGATGPRRRGLRFAESGCRVGSDRLSRLLCRKRCGEVGKEPQDQQPASRRVRSGHGASSRLEGGHFGRAIACATPPHWTLSVIQLRGNEVNLPKVRPG